MSLAAKTGQILVVDDDPLALLALKDFLAQHGYVASTVSSAEEAMSNIESRLPDAILLDIQMPGLNGLDFLNMLRHDPRTNGVPVILISGLDDTEHFIRGLEEGAYDYITKPVNLPVLLMRLKAHLNDTRRLSGAT